MNDLDIPIKPSMTGKYIFTTEALEYIKSFAVDGVILFDDYIRAVNKIMNR